MSRNESEINVKFIAFTHHYDLILEDVSPSI